MECQAKKISPKIIQRLPTDYQKKEDVTVFTRTEDNNDNEKAKDSNPENRKTALEKLKEVVENKN